LVDLYLLADSGKGVVQDLEQVGTVVSEAPWILVDVLIIVALLDFAG